MCGIIAVLRRPSDRPVPSAQSLLGPLAGLASTLGVPDVEL